MSYASASFYGPAHSSMVTQALGLSPSSSHNVGDRRSVRNDLLWESSRWSLKSDLPPEGDGLEAHLRRLLDLLTSKRREIDQLVTDGWTLVWACFISEDNGQGGINLSHLILRDLGDLPGELWLDIYAGDAEDEHEST
jgi:hypothetical protein